MNIQRIRYFLKIVETLNIKRASEELYVSRQALSKQIQLLEDEIGACLLERSTNHVVVTEIGGKVYEVYKPIMNQIDDAQKKIERFVQYKKDYLKLAYFNALPYDIFVEPFIDMWRKMFPDSIVNIIAAEAGVDKELIMNDSVDLLVANVLDFNEWDGAEVIPLMPREMKIIVSENHPWYNKEVVSEEDIAEASMQVYGNRPIFLPEIKPKERIVMYNSSSYMANLRQGYAFGVVSDVHLFWEGNFRLIDFPGDKRYYSYFSLVFKQFHPLAGKIRKVGKILHNQLENQI